MNRRDFGLHLQCIAIILSTSLLHFDGLLGGNFLGILFFLVRHQAEDDFAVRRSCADLQQKSKVSFAANKAAKTGVVFTQARHCGH